MPIEYRIDSARRIVLAKGVGIFSDADVFNYQREVWSRPEVAGFSELMDMSEVKEIAIATTQRIRQLAELATNMDTSLTSSKFAIIAPDDTAFGLARMFGSYRTLTERSKKEVAVFRTRVEAFKFLGIKEDASHEA